MSIPFTGSKEDYDKYTIKFTKNCLESSRRLGERIITCKYGRIVANKEDADELYESEKGYMNDGAGGFYSKRRQLYKAQLNSLNGKIEEKKLTLPPKYDFYKLEEKNLTMSGYKDMPEDNISLLRSSMILKDYLDSTEHSDAAGIESEDHIFKEYGNGIVIPKGGGGKIKKINTRKRTNRKKKSRKSIKRKSSKKLRKSYRKKSKSRRRR